MYIGFCLNNIYEVIILFGRTNIRRFLKVIEEFSNQKELSEKLICSFSPSFIKDQFPEQFYEN